MNMTGAAGGTGTAYPSGVTEFIPWFLAGVHVTRSIILCVCFVDCCLSFCTFVLFALRFTDYDYPFGIFRFTDYDYPFGIFKLLLVTQGCFL